MLRVLKISSIVLGCVLLLLTGIVIFLITPPGQRFVRGRVESYLRHKLKTDVWIGHLGYDIPKYIVLNDVLMLDKAKDTMLAAGTLKVDLDMIALLHKRVDVQKALVKDVRSHVYRHKHDTDFNFTYVLNAFAGKKVARNAKVDTSLPLDFRLSRLVTDNIHLKLDDEAGGAFLLTDLDHLALKVNKADFYHMAFDVKDLAVVGLRTVFTNDSSYLPPTLKDTTQKLKLKADNVALNRIAFDYDDKRNKFALTTKVEQVLFQLNEYNRAKNNTVDVKKLAISNSTGSLKFGKSSSHPSPIDTIVKIDTTEGWFVKAAAIDLKNINFKIDNQNEPSLKGLDYWHLDARDLAMAARNFNYNSLSYPSIMDGRLLQFTVDEQHSGLKVNEMRTVFHYTNQGLELKDFYAETPHSKVRDYIAIQYPFREPEAAPLQKLKLKVNIVNSYVGLTDVAIFAPVIQNQEMYSRLKNSRINIEANADGYVNDMNINKLYLKGLSNTEIFVSGKMRGLPDANKVNYNLHISRLQSGRNDLSLLMPKSALANIRIPDRFGASGTLAGTTSVFSGDVTVMSTDGIAHVRGTLRPTPGRERYDLVVQTRGLNIGRILKQQPMLGSVTGYFDVKGNGLDIKTMNIDFNAQVASAYVNGYTYSRISARGHAAGKLVNATLTAKDPNAELELTGKGDFSGKYPAIYADADITHLDLQALRLYPTELKVSGIVHASIDELNPDYPRGTLSWKELGVVADGKRYSTDSVFISSRPDVASGQNLYVNVDFLEATLTGHVPLSTIPVIVQQRIDRYYYAAVPTIDSAFRNATNVIAARTWKGRRGDKVDKGIKITKSDKAVPDDYDLKLTARMVDRPLLHAFMPMLKSFDPVQIDGSLTPRLLTLNAKTSSILFDSVVITNLKTTINGNDSNLTYAVTADRISRGQQKLWYASATGSLDNGIITTAISLSDSERNERFAVKANMRATDSAQIIQIEPGLKLNYVVWNVSQPNYIGLNSNGAFVQNLELSSGTQVIKANSEWPRTNAPLKIAFTGFELQTISEIISKSDSQMVTGALSGTVTVAQTKPPFKITGDLTVANLAVRGDTLGNLHATIVNVTENSLQTKATLKGNGTDITVSGVYYPTAENGNNFNLQIDVNQLAAHNIEGFTMNQIRNSSGNIRGSLRVTGTFDAPQVIGQLKTDNLTTTISALGSELKMPSEQIDFTPGRVQFNTFNLVDPEGNRATVSGGIDISHLFNPEFDMHIKADHWHALHSTAKDNQLFYGDLYINADVRIKGSVSNPSSEGNVEVLKNTKLTIVNPDVSSAAASPVGIVEFINPNDSNTSASWAATKRDTTRLLRVKPKNAFNLNVTASPDAEFIVIVDQGTGDYVSVKGDAKIAMSIKPDGVIEMYGTATVRSGHYQMNYNFIKRRFVLQPGGTANFNGDIMKNTTIDVVATYEATIPPYDLIARQVNDPGELVYFKQRLPFNVNVHATGNMMLPTLKFDIDLPENKVYPITPDNIDLVQARLTQLRADTAEMNKQVFAVLIFNHFLSDDGFRSSASRSVSSVAMQSMSAFIENELNSATGNLIKGVDLSVDLASTDDYTTGSLRRRTDLSVTASKRLMNDRLKLTVGNNFELEGPQTSNNRNSGVPSNLAADYLLTGDGRYMMRVYHSNYDAGVLQGFVQENGVTFIMSRDYNKFKQIFMRRPRRPQTSASANRN